AFLAALSKRIDTSKKGTSTSGSETITGLTDTLKRLVTGMTVKGPGLPSRTKIAAIPNDTSVTLSAKAGTGAGSGTFTFSYPDYWDMLVASQLYNISPFQGFLGGIFVGG